MLNKQGIRFSGRRRSELKKTPGEIVRDHIIEVSKKAAEEAAYTAGNKTDSFVELAQKLDWNR